MSRTTQIRHCCLPHRLRRAPVWWLSLQHDPNAAIEIRGQSTAVSAAVASPADHERLWKQLVAICPTYDDYVKRTERHIPVVLLTPSA